LSNGWPDPQHTPAVSHSSISKFRSCDRAWALQYHHAIIGDIEARHQFKREARLQPLNCYPGSIFHETIQTALMAYQRKGAFPKDLMAIAIVIAKEYRHFAKEWIKDVNEHPILGRVHPYWPSHSFAQPIDCLYFDGKFPPRFNPEVKEKLARWCDRFTSLLNDMDFTSVNPRLWRFPKTAAQKIPWFIHNDSFAVYAAFDFLTRDGENVSIYDWKTGQRSRGEEQVAEQLTTYAAYAVATLKVKLDTINLYAVWVDDGSIQKVECDRYEIERLQKIWQGYHDTWSLRLDQVNGDSERLLDLFPMTNDIRTCSRCNFRSCEGRNRITASSSLPTGADSAHWED
jgi:hypothetical protein